MDVALESSAFDRNESLKRVHAVGDRMMSLSGLRYEGQFMSVGEYERIHVMEFGSGPPVVLVHGAGSGGPVWHRQIAALAPDHRVIVLDIPMFGLSAMPERVYAPRQQISDVILGVMNELDIEKADIGGHSMGAIGTIGALAREPERFNRAVLMAPPGFGQGLNFALRIASVRFVQPFINYGSRKARYFFFDRFEAQKSGPSDERELWKELHFQVGNRDSGVATFNEGLRSFAGIWGQRDILDTDLTARIQAPTLLVWGDSDLIIPTRQSRRALELLADARLELLENCGHIIQLEAPERATELMVDWFHV